jgi:hypothetical protein
MTEAPGGGGAGVTAAHDDWTHYLEEVERLVVWPEALTSPTSDVPVPVHPTAALPVDLAARARRSLSTLAEAERRLEHRLDDVRGEMRAASRARTRMAATAPRSSTLDVSA